MFSSNVFDGVSGNRPLLSISSSTFIGNKASTGNGGAMSLIETDAEAPLNALYKANTARVGAAMYLSRSSFSGV